MQRFSPFVTFDGTNCPQRGLIGSVGCSFSLSFFFPSIRDTVSSLPSPPHFVHSPLYGYISSSFFLLVQVMEQNQHRLLICWQCDHSDIKEDTQSHASSQYNFTRVLAFYQTTRLFGVMEKGTNTCSALLPRTNGQILCVCVLYPIFLCRSITFHPCIQCYLSPCAISTFFSRIKDLHSHPR